MKNAVIQLTVAYMGLKCHPGLPPVARELSGFARRPALLEWLFVLEWYCF